MLGTDKRQTIIGIFAIKKEDAEPADDLEDDNLGNIANALTILFGLMYSLDLSCPHTHTNKYTFEVLQKLLMELDGSHLSIKA
ncbi:sterile alpha motif domain-containing protein 3-like protein [Lates japonicus]|uniref:Sterile alpha motif domain-containing protein 3-like protein n=1 Tax=Lates japonicus TaxID=270547 RepID=A0AAD3MST6_LATJO|nr:sterile alpha motif domain-containing protein 3-like protein [Lates japonicus]